MFTSCSDASVPFEKYRIIVVSHLKYFHANAGSVLYRSSGSRLYQEYVPLDCIILKNNYYLI